MKKVLLGFAKGIGVLVSIGITAVFLLAIGLDSGNAGVRSSGNPVDVAIMDRYDMYVNNGLSTALEGVLAIVRQNLLANAEQLIKFLSM